MDQLTVANESTFHPVRLDGETPIPLRIQSIAQDLDILLVDQATVRCDPNLWARCEVRFLNLRDLGQGLKALPLSPNLPALEIRVTPLSLKALTASLLPFKRSAAVKGAAERAGEDAECGVHDRLTVSIRYRSRGGLERLLTRELPIRFVPSVWSLLGAASSGALFGSLMPIVFGRRRRKGWLKAAGAAVALGLLVEAIATVVASFDTMVRILGFQVDPLQILPTFVLGALVGLRGFESVEDFKGFFKPKTEKAGAEG
jgi:hypothetical protein